MRKVMPLVFTLLCTFGLSLPAMADAADSLPAGIIAIAPDKMNWKDAKAYCASKGGRLPFIGGKNALPFSQKIPSGTPVDGFGAMGAKWPPDMPVDLYWTGTEHSGYPRHSWLVVNSGGYVSDNFVTQGNTRRVVCVP